MEIWLDTLNLSLIELAESMGILHGVTTNPSILSKAKKPLEEVLESILAAQKGPLAVQVIAQEASEMVYEAEKLQEISPRIIVKVPVTKEGLAAISTLTKKDIPTLATTVFNPRQALLAATAGAKYIAPYYSKIELEGEDPLAYVNSMLRIIERYRFKTKILAASLKTTIQFTACAEAGVPAVTVKDELFQEIIKNNPQTMQYLDAFATDWQSSSFCNEFFNSVRV